jgi:hypothetical protein
MTTISMKRPSAWLPVVMSLAAVAIVLVHFARYGIVYEEDEGTSAHLFQILIVLEVPIVGYFALRWLPEAPGPALRVLGLQAAGVAVAFASVYFLTGG